MSGPASLTYGVSGAQGAGRECATGPVSGSAGHPGHDAQGSGHGGHDAARAADRAAALAAFVRRGRLAGRQLWLAGLGAAAVAAGAAPRLAARGRRLAERLAEKGQPLAERQAARLESLGEQASRVVAGARKLARETAEFETRRLLERFELATVEDLRRLGERLEALDRKLDDYGRRLARSAAATTTAPTEG